MKKFYQTPDFEYIRISAEDVLTISDNDAEFVPPAGDNDDGYSGYH